MQTKIALLALSGNAVNIDASSLAMRLVRSFDELELDG